MFNQDMNGGDFAGGRRKSMFAPADMGKTLYLKMGIKELKQQKMFALLNNNYRLANDFEIIILAKELDMSKDLRGEEVEGFAGDEVSGTEEISGLGEIGELNSLFGQFYGGEE